MCGFIGAYGTKLTREEINGALRSIQHRGPNGVVYVEKGPLRLAACRLAIVPPMDVSPVVIEDCLLVTLNGELYSLGPCSSEAITTDTQRLAEHFRQFGTELLTTLEGLFAIGVLQENCLLLARDRFGIKPLYYARFQGGLVFASEMKAILALPGFSRTLDPGVISSFEVIGYNVFPGRTPFASIQALTPGSCLTFLSGSRLEVHSFASVADPPSPGEGQVLAEAELTNQLESLLTNAVLQSISHDPQPKALFFSGGLDSTLLLAVTRSMGDVTPFVLTDRANSDDFVEAQRLSMVFGVPLRTALIEDCDLDRELVHYAWHFEHPIVGASFDLLGGVAFHCLARAVAAEFRVAMCGEGADELFMGYHQHHVRPENLIQTFARHATTCGNAEMQDWLESKGMTVRHTGVSRSVRNLALHEGLSEYHLQSVDRSGMAFGLEIRPPYLDNHLVAFATRLDESVLVDRDSNWTKLPLRSLARQCIPAGKCDRVAVRRKRAMSFAVEKAAARLASRIAGTSGDTDPVSVLQPLLRNLFYYLHVDPGCSTCPDFALSEFAAHLTRREVAL